MSLTVECSTDAHQRCQGDLNLGADAEGVQISEPCECWCHRDRPPGTDDDENWTPTP